MEIEDQIKLTYLKEEKEQSKLYLTSTIVEYLVEKTIVTHTAKITV